MPKRGASGIKNLYKKHNNDCRNRAPLKCDCPWYGKYKRVNVNLARWSALRSVAYTKRAQNVDAGQ